MIYLVRDGEIEAYPLEVYRRLPLRDVEDTLATFDPKSAALLALAQKARKERRS